MLKLIAGAAAIGAALVLAPPALADPDAHVPDGNAQWCPGGEFHERISGGGTYCLGTEYADGTFYSQGRGHSTSPFGPGYWMDTVHCSHWGETQTVQPSAPPSGCGGGPDTITH